MPAVLRLKGYCWLATRPDWVGQLSGAGKLLNIDAAGTWWAASPRASWPRTDDFHAFVAENFVAPYGDRKQEIVFIGRNLDRTGLEAALTACLLTTSEEKAGMRAWSRYADPLPAWDVEEQLESA